MSNADRSALRRLAAGVMALALALAGTGFAAPSPASAADPTPAGTTEIVARSGVGLPRGMAAGADGALWFTTERPDGGSVGRMTVDGHDTVFPDLHLASPGPIVSGPDGNLWLTDAASGTVDRLTTAGALTEFGGPPLAHPTALVAAPDGTLRVADGERILRVATDGTVTDPDGPLGVAPLALAVGGDGAVWFTAPTCGSGCAGPGIGRLADDGTRSVWPLTGISAAGDLAVGPAGTLWAVDAAVAYPGQIAEVALDGTVTRYPLPDAYRAEHLEPGSDGQMWFTGAYRCPSACGEVDRFGALGKIDAAGAVTMIIATTDPLTTDPSQWRSPIGAVADLAVGPDGDVWAADGGGLGLVGDTGPALDRFGADGALARFMAGAFDVTGGSFRGGRKGLRDASGNLWFLARAGITRVSAGGGIDSLEDPRLSGISDLALDPDGSIWATVRADCYPSTTHVCTHGSLVHITAGFQLTVIAGPLTGAPHRLVVTADGSVWFTNDWECDAYIAWCWPGGLVRRRPTGELEAVPLFGGATDPPALTGDLVALPDGDVWVALAATDWPGPAGIARVHPDLSVTVFTLAHAAGNLVVGADGAIWFTPASWCVFEACTDTGRIGRVALDGTESSFASPLLHLPTYPVLAGDGSIWFADETSSGTPVGRIGTDGTISRFADPTLNPVGATQLDSLVLGYDGRLYGIDRTHTALVALETGGPAPSAPQPATGVVVEGGVPGDGAATIHWNAPADTGSAPLVGARVVAAPGGGSCTATSSSSSCTIFGLDPGTATTFTVTVTNAARLSAVSAPSAPVHPRTAGSRFVPVTPFRLGDTRPDANLGFPPEPLADAVPRSLTVAGVGAVPPDARAVVANVTVTGGTAAGWLAVTPDGASPAPTANLLYAGGETVANLVTVGLGVDGTIAFTAHGGAVDAVVDLLGYYDDPSVEPVPGAGGWVAARPPERVLDSRDPTGPWAGSPLGGDAARRLTVAGVGGVPADATAIVATVTVTGGSAASYLQVTPAGAPASTTANLLFAPGQTVANLVVVGVGEAGGIDLVNQQGLVDVVVDVVGWYAPVSGDRFHPIAPRRLLDSRLAGDPASAWPGTPLGPGGLRGIGLGSLADDVTGVTGNLTATEGKSASLLTLAPAPGVVPPSTATLLFAAGQTVPVGVVVGAGATMDGPAVDVANQRGSVHVVLDLVGYFAPPPV